jgi:hypothetical protein
MVNSKPSNRAKGARRVRRSRNKNVQQMNQTSDNRGRGNGGVPRAMKSMVNTKAFEIVEYDEYIAPVSGSVAFAATKYPLNPGLPGSFPAGSKEAQLWTEWSAVGVEYYLKPLVSGFSAQGQTGKNLLSFDYNPVNPAPSNQSQAEIMHKADGMPYENIRLRLDCAQVNRADGKYIRTAAAPIGTDLKTYDGGNLWVCTYGQPGTAVCAELRAKYRFRVMKPTLLNAPVGAGQIESTGGSSSGAVFGTAPLATGAFGLSSATSVLSLTNLVIGNEYAINTSIVGTVLGTLSYTSPVGMVAVSALAATNAGATQALDNGTFRATAVTASVTLSITATTISSATTVVSDLGAASTDLF